MTSSVDLATAFRRIVLLLAIISISTFVSVHYETGDAAQSSTTTWDLRLSDLAVDSGAGDGDGFAELGENVTTEAMLELDLSGGALPLEPLLDVTALQFDGLAPYAAADLSPLYGGAAIVPPGTVVGRHEFVMESNIIGGVVPPLPNTGCDPVVGLSIAPPPSSIVAAGANFGTAQPVAIPVGPGHVWGGAYVQTFDDDDNSASVLAAGVAVQDETPPLGDLAEDQEDTSPANGLPDGVDRMPYFIPTLLAGPFSSVQPGYLGRAHQVIQIVPGVLHTSMHYIDFALGDIDGDTDEDYLTVTLTGDPVSDVLPGPEQDFIYCAPYIGRITEFGVSSTSITLRTLGTLSYTGAAASPFGGTGSYRLIRSSVDNFDGDDMPAPFDNCTQFSNDLQLDTDGDGAGDACDPNPGLANDDEDGDGWYNLIDSCPSVADVGQADADSDSVGDACDPNPLTEGDGLGYATPAPGSYEDDDDVCDDPWVVGSAEPLGDPVGLPFGPARFCIAATIPFNDSDDDVAPDYVPGTLVVDVDSDRDYDLIPDCTESGGGGIGACPLGAVGDPLDPSDGMFAAAVLDEDGDGHPSQQEVTDVAVGVLGADRSVAQCGASSIDPSRTGSDLDYDGTVTIIDLSAAAGYFNGAYGNVGTYHFGSDFDKDAANTILDLSAMAAYFNQAACP